MPRSRRGSPRPRFTPRRSPGSTAGGEQWDIDLAFPDRPYAPASFPEEGFVHCSPDEPVTLAVASVYYHDIPGPLMVLLIAEHKLDVTVRWEAASPGPPPGVAPDTLFPHVYGRINRDAVERMMEVQRDTDGNAVALAVWP